MKNLLNKALNIDCFDGIKLIEEKSIDLICTDIPYFNVVDEEWDNQWENRTRIL